MGWTDGAESIGLTHGETIELASVSDVELWVLGVLFFGVGDLATTGIGVSINGITEANPFVASTIFEGGLLAMGGIKLLTFATFLFAWWLAPRPERIGIPLALSVVGISVTLWNLHVLVLITGSNLGLL